MTKISKEDLYKIEHDTLMKYIESYNSPDNPIEPSVMSGMIGGIVGYTDIACSYIDAIDNILIDENIE